jgi:hypothetical protein
MPVRSADMPPIPPGSRRRVDVTVDGKDLPSLPGDRGPDGSDPWTMLRSLLQLPQGSPGSLTFPHMVGNLNVFVTGSAPVERHMERALGLRPGCPNMALFSVGDGLPDRYTFSVGVTEPGWKADLRDVEWNSPIEFGTTMIVLTIEPPPEAVRGRFSVLVRRHSIGKTVPVEFELDAAAVAECRTF